MFYQVVEKDPPWSFSMVAPVKSIHLRSQNRRFKRFHETPVLAKHPVSHSSLFFNSLLSCPGESRTASQIEVPALTEYTPLTEAETESLKVAVKRMEEEGFLTPKSQRMQAEAVRDMLNFLNSDEYTVIIEITGPIPGIEKGDTFQDLVDYSYAEMEQPIAHLNIEELRAFRNITNEWAFTLAYMGENAMIDADTISHNEIDYALVRLVQLREKIIRQMKKLEREELQNAI